MANTQKVEIRVSFTRDTLVGSLSDCIVYQLSDFLTDPTKVKIGTQKVLADIDARTSSWVAAVTVARENAEEILPLTDDELFYEFEADIQKRERLGQWLRDKGYIEGIE